jgi:dolichyl-phosphate-mannose-protein mannosyltransferase
LICLTQCSNLKEMLRADPLTVQSSLSTARTTVRDSFETARVRKVRLTGLLLGCASLAFFLFGITDPTTFLYDEPQYVLSAKALLSEAPNPNPEAPPLGKLILAVGMKTFGYNPLGWRSMSALFGALTLVGVFLLAQVLLGDYALALTAALLTLLNNFLFVMSRLAMMDIFLVAFLMWGLLGYTAVLKLDNLSTRKRRGALAFSGTMFGFACACKWNGVDTLGIAFAVGALLLWRAKGSQNQEIRRCGEHLREVGTAWFGVCLTVVPVVAYSLTYWPLCRSLHRPFEIRELLAMNVYIWHFHRLVQGNPAIMSAWYSWPLQIAPQRALSYLVGNWFIMFGGLAALTFCASRLWTSVPEALVVLLYVGNLLQWAVTPQRCQYYYYYFPAAMFLSLAIPVALHRLPTRVLGVRLSLLCLLPAAYCFLFCYPHMTNLQAPFDCALGCW